MSPRNNLLPLGQNLSPNSTGEEAPCAILGRTLQWWGWELLIASARHCRRQECMHVQHPRRHTEQNMNLLSHCSLLSGVLLRLAFTIFRGKRVSHRNLGMWLITHPEQPGACAGRALQQAVRREELGGALGASGWHCLVTRRLWDAGQSSRSTVHQKPSMASLTIASIGKVCCIVFFCFSPGGGGGLKVFP